MDIPSKQGKELGDGRQLTLENLTFETPNTVSCKVMAPSVPGLEQSKKVSVAVEGKSWPGCRVSPACPALPGAVGADVPCPQGSPGSWPSAPRCTCARTRLST